MQYTQRLEDLRKDRDLTQAQVAKLLNLQREQYRRYETGINEAKVGFIKEVCKLYSASVLPSLKTLCHQNIGEFHIRQATF